MVQNPKQENAEQQTSSCSMEGPKMECPERISTCESVGIPCHRPNLIEHLRASRHRIHSLEEALAESKRIAERIEAERNALVEIIRMNTEILAGALGKAGNGS